MRYSLPRTCFGHSCARLQGVNKIYRKYTGFMIRNILVNVLVYVFVSLAYLMSLTHGCGLIRIKLPFYFRD